jgi:hypothetical protein
MESPSTEALIQFLERGATGRLTVGNARKNFKVFVRQGEIVGATSTADAQRLLHRLSLEKRLPISQVKMLEQQLKRGNSIIGSLLEELDSHLLEKFFFEQYLNNISSYLGANSAPYYKGLTAVFTDNLQLGHDPMAIIQRCAQAWDEASMLNPRAKLVIGPRPPEDDLQGLIFERLNQRPRSATTLAMSLPLEPIAARALVYNMIRKRMAVVDGDPRQVPLTPKETHAVESMNEIRQYAAQVNASEINASKSGSGNLSDLKSWLKGASDVAEEDLTAFDDHDIHRGSVDEGAFSADSVILDRVDVKNVEPLEEPDLGEPVNLIPAPSPAKELPPVTSTTNFSAPILDTDEAASKLSVTNEILETIATSFDQIEGDGRGQQVIVELIEAGPLRYATLFDNAGVHEDGTLENASILGNLHNRPTGEHRQLLNQGLSDLIERCLSTAADELPDDTVDTILEQVVGYRQRLGL